MDEQTSILHYLNAVKQQAPLVVNITNYVAMNNSANALLALGASPIMAHSREELSEMVALCGALVINIGTLDSVWCERMTIKNRWCLTPSGVARRHCGPPFPVNLHNLLSISSFELMPLKRWRLLA